MHCVWCQENAQDFHSPSINLPLTLLHKAELSFLNNFQLILRFDILQTGTSLNTLYMIMYKPVSSLCYFHIAYFSDALTSVPPFLCCICIANSLLHIFSWILKHSMPRLNILCSTTNHKPIKAFKPTT